MSADLFAMVTNNTFLLAPDANLLFAADIAWWFKHPEAFEFKGEKFVASKDARVPVQYMKPPVGHASGSNSALLAARLAKERGAKKVLLFGVDLRDDELTHWHGDHEGLKNPCVGAFNRARAAWTAFSKEKDNPTIINCNPRSGLDCFPKMSMESALS